jgi:cyclopropane fatty-acyl-phospholipid synthase-like methyltransferase
MERRIWPLTPLLLFLFVACGSSHRHALEAERLEDLLRLAPGVQVADVGAGDGEWSESMARAVGPEGHVFSTEVDADDLERIRRRIEDAGLSNVTAILGDELDTGLPAGCCDAILLRLVYHHFTEPEAMRASLDRALHDDGRLVVVEIKPQKHWAELEGVPDRGGHGIPPDDLVEEMASGGFEVLERHDRWDAGADHYCVVFRKREATSDAGRDEVP